MGVDFQPEKIPRWIHVLVSFGHTCREMEAMIDDVAGKKMTDLYARFEVDQLKVFAEF